MLISSEFIYTNIISRSGTIEGTTEQKKKKQLMQKKPPHIVIASEKDSDTDMVMCDRCHGSRTSSLVVSRSKEKKDTQDSRLGHVSSPPFPVPCPGIHSLLPRLEFTVPVSIRCCPAVCMLAVVTWRLVWCGNF
jgi:hypothetical protein